MTTELAFSEPGLVETRQERAMRRIAALQNAFQSVFEVLAEIYRDEDWRYINDGGGRPYTGFTAFVQDQLGCAASNARRYQQGIVGLVLPLQQVALPGARIPVTSSDVARLGVAGARVVVEEAPAALEGVADREGQTEALRKLIDSVAQRSTSPGFGPLRESTVVESPLGSLVPAEVPELPAPAAELGEGGGAAQSLWAAGNEQGGDPAPSVEASPSIDEDDQGQPQRSGPQHPAWMPDRPAAAVTEPAIQDGDACGEPAGDPAALAALQAAITAVLSAGDPAELADRLSRGEGAALAPKCLASGQRLVRLGQLLRSLA